MCDQPLSRPIPYSPDRYNEAMITIRRIPSVDHNFELVVTRVYEDEDQELLEDEDESKAPSQTVPCGTLV